MHSEYSAEALKRQYERSQLLSDITLKIRQSLDLNTILETAATEVKQFLLADRVLVFELKLHAEGLGTVVQEAVNPGFTQVYSYDLFDPCLKQRFVERYCQGRISAIEDIDCADIQPCHAEFLKQFEVKANLVVPILQQNSLWGLLICHQCDRPRQWTPMETELLRQVADQIGIALSQSQLLHHLEQQVKARTIELSAANAQLQQEIEERRQVEQALRTSEAQLRLTTDALPALIAYVDSQQRYQFVNKTYEAWHGIPKAELIGHHVRDLLKADIYQQIKPAIEQALSGQRTTVETKITFKDKTLHHISGTYIPNTSADGEVKGFFFLGNDVSEQNEVARMKNEFISIVSHELRTPLTSIYGSLKLLKMTTESSFSKDDLDMLNIAVSSSKRLIRLVNDILDLERIESGKVTLIKQRCYAGQMLSQAADAMMMQANKQGIAIATQADSIEFWADPDHIHQTLTNLLSNAIRFSPQGATIWLTAQVNAREARANNREVLFSVKDQGRGIPANKLEAIFERFQQVDASDAREKEGTGLGLPICHNIVRKHGGRIWVESALGQGSIFYFTLPIE